MSDGCDYLHTLSAAHIIAFRYLARWSYSLGVQVLELLAAESRASNTRGAVCKMQDVLANERSISVDTLVHCTSRE